jgi:hypothetical protein
LYLLFWLLWLINAAFAVLILYSNSFKSHHSGLDFDKMLVIGTCVVLVSSLVIRFVFKRPQVGMWIVAVPVVLMVFSYIWEKFR